MVTGVLVDSARERRDGTGTVHECDSESYGVTYEGVFDFRRSFARRYHLKGDDSRVETVPPGHNCTVGVRSSAGTRGSMPVDQLILIAGMRPRRVLLLHVS